MSAANTKNSLGDDWILLEIHGPDVRADNVDVRSALAVAHRYVDLVSALVDEDAAEFTFTGLKVIDKFVLLASKPASPTSHDVRPSISTSRRPSMIGKGIRFSKTSSDLPLPTSPSIPKIRRRRRRMNPICGHSYSVVGGFKCPS